jgi:hypothetical protein
LTDARRALPILSGPSWLAIALMFAVGAILQLSSPTTPDVSWLFVVDEKLLAGARLYVDIIETNPPMSAMLYMPAVLLQKATGVSADVLQVWLTLALMAGSLGLTAHILRQVCERAEAARIIVAGAFVLVNVPMFTFSEREHFATALMLPSLALLTARMQGRDIALLSRLLIGVGAGLAVTIKPHFALALLLPAIYVAIRGRSIRSLLVWENWIAAAVVAVYAVVIVVGFPLYLTQILPMLSETYRSAKLPLSDLLLTYRFLLTVGAGIAIVAAIGLSQLALFSRMALLAALGFLFAYIEQGKGWPYHLYPSIALVVLTYISDAMPRFTQVLRSLSERRLSAMPPVVAMVAGLACLAVLMPALKYRYAVSLPLAEEINRTVPHPKVLALSYDLAVGHPLTRLVGGEWVGTFCSQWLTATAIEIGQQSDPDAATEARLKGWIDRDRAFLAHDLREGRPDVVVVDNATFDLPDLMASGGEAAELLRDHYVRVDSAGSVDLMVRRDRVAATVANHAREN